MNNNTIQKPCPDWQETLAKLHPHDRSTTEQKALEYHLSICHQCAIVHDEYQAITRLIRDLPIDDLPDEVPPQLLPILTNHQIHTASTENKPNSVTAPSLLQHIVQPGKRMLLWNTLAAILIMSILISSFFWFSPPKHTSTTIIPNRTSNTTPTSGGPGAGGDPGARNGLAIAWGPQLSLLASNVYVNYNSLNVFTNNGRYLQRYSFPGSTFSHSPVLINNTLYLAAMLDGEREIKGVIYAVHPDNGTVIWQTPVAGQGITIVPTLVQGIMIVSAGSGLPGSPYSYLYGISASTGHILWTHTWTNNEGDMLTDPVIAGITVYLHSATGQTVYALGAIDGHQLWTQQLPEDTLSNAVTINNMLYISTKGAVYALSTLNGNVIWRHPLRNEYKNEYRSRLAVENNTLFLGSIRGSLYAFNASSGSLLWQHQFNSIRDSRFIISGKYLYIADVSFDTKPSRQLPDEYYVAVETISGHIAWKRLAGENNVIHSIAAGNGVVYTASFSQRQLYALNGDTGKVLWQQTIPEPL